MKVLLLFAAGLCLAAAVHDRVIDNVESFTGFKVYRVFPGDQDLEFVQSFQNVGLYDFWTEVRQGHPTDIMVPPKVQGSFIKKLQDRGIQFEVMIPDVQALIDLQRVQTRSSFNASAGHAMTWDEYHPLEDMYSYLDYLEATYDFVTTESIGKSHEGRDMRVAKVCRGGCGNKPAAWVDGGIHAREWVSPATVTWMLRELVENDADHPDLTENLDWYILPSHNPDGYAYSQGLTNRLWRKTRSDHGSIFGCKGVDANRNWGYHWNEGGSSNDKCSDTYHGPEAFSEVENTNVRDFILAHKDRLIFYNTIHSYSQLILLPWSYTDEPPPNYDELLATAMRGAIALTEVHGKTYTVGCIPCLLYVASGGSLDWTLGVAGINFSMAMELRDTGIYGFLLPPAQIIPTAEETWAFHVSVIREIYEKTLL